uniref:Olfactory receptor n=1 Tax=Apolygus lucorum TaxID=248454 RepID=A0A1Q1NIQ7_APOLU|nr:olfactory receptor [Apolygus lucorum]
MKCVAIGDERYFLFFSIMLGMGLVLCVPCEIGYRATLHAGTYIVEMLSSVNMLEQDELTAREVDLFLQAVYSNYPDISYGGMVTVNRETITSIFSATVTYLIVLLQLRMDHKLIQSTSLTSALGIINSTGKGVLEGFSTPTSLQ